MLAHRNHHRIRPAAETRQSNRIAYRQQSKTYLLSNKIRYRTIKALKTELFAGPKRSSDVAIELPGAGAFDDDGLAAARNQGGVLRRGSEGATRHPFEDAEARAEREEAHIEKAIAGVWRIALRARVEAKRVGGVCGDDEPAGVVGDFLAIDPDAQRMWRGMDERIERFGENGREIGEVSFGFARAAADALDDRSIGAERDHEREAVRFFDLVNGRDGADIKRGGLGARDRVCRGVDVARVAAGSREEVLIAAGEVVDRNPRTDAGLERAVHGSVAAHDDEGAATGLELAIEVEGFTDREGTRIDAAAFECGSHVVGVTGCVRPAGMLVVNDQHLHGGTCYRETARSSVCCGMPKSHSQFPNLVEFDHPLIQHKMSWIRDEATGHRSFRGLLAQIAGLMVFEVTRSLPVSSVRVRTPLEMTEARRLSANITVVPILRSGLGMIEGILYVMPEARVGHLGIARDHETLEPVAYLNKLPRDLEAGPVLLVDPMLATGGSASAAITMLREAGAKDLRMICLVAAPEGVRRLLKDHPDVMVYTAALDRQLTEKGYITPGLGDAGDRMYGTG